MFTEIQLPYFVMTLIVSTLAEARCQQEVFPGQALPPAPGFPLRDIQRLAGCYEDPTVDRSLSRICLLQSLSFGAKNGHGPLASFAIAVSQSRWAQRQRSRDERTCGQPFDQWHCAGYTKQWHKRCAR